MTDASKKGARLGLDIGGTSIKAVILSDDYRVIETTEVLSRAEEGPEAVYQSLRAVIHSYSDRSLRAVGIGCAGSVDPMSGTVRNSPNFAKWQDVPLQKQIEKDVPLLKVVVENDANCAAYGEWKTGNGKGAQNLVLITLGTGVGGGLILDNRLYRGSTGTGGELGHFTLHADGIPCPCGSRGCFERYCSASALRSLLPHLSARDVFEKKNEAVIQPIVRVFIENLSAGLVSLANIFDPDCILIGGGLLEGIIPFFPEIRESVQKHAFPAPAAHLKILPTLHGNLSGAIGAALLVDD